MLIEFEIQFKFDGYYYDYSLGYRVSDYWYNGQVDRYENDEDTKAFIKEDGKLFRYKPHGVTWDDNFCRKVERKRNTGCFVETEFNQNLGKFKLCLYFMGNYYSETVYSETMVPI